MHVMTGKSADQHGTTSAADTVGTGYPILIIDDHELFSTSLAIALGSEGFDARTLKVADVEGFLDRPAITPTGLVVLDLDLGRDADGRHVNGVDLTEALRARGWMVLVVSGNDGGPGIAAAIAAGAIGYIPKSLSLDVLLQTVVTAAEGAPVMTDAEHRTWLDVHRKHLAQERDLARRLARLSPREREVHRLLAEGMRASAIAEHFVVSMPTVRSQIQAILTKLEVGSQLEAAALFRHQSTAAGHRFVAAD
jgi:DNA-binding NarL/FixJ family response regulator